MIYKLQDKDNCIEFFPKENGTMYISIYDFDDIVNGSGVEITLEEVEELRDCLLDAIKYMEKHTKADAKNS